LSDVDAMFLAAQKAERVLAEAFMYRHHPKILKVKALVDEGALGDVHSLRASFSFTLTRPNDIRWNREMGGGALWDVGCYPVSLARYLFGAPVRVQGWQVTAPGGVDETFVGVLHFAGQRMAQIDCSFRMPARQSAEVVGSRAGLFLTQPFRPDAESSRLRLLRGEREEEIQLENPGRYSLEVENMHAAVLTGQAPLITPAETRGVVQTILDLYQAART
jgi:predicted dehydrogenase